MSTDTDRAALTSMSVLSADVVERLVGPGPGVPGVEEKTLWRFGDFVVALIRYSPGSAARVVDTWRRTTTSGSFRATPHAGGLTTRGQATSTSPWR